MVDVQDIRSKKELFQKLEEVNTIALDDIFVWSVRSNVLRQWKSEEIEIHDFVFRRLNEFHDRLEAFAKELKIKDYEINRLKGARNDWKKIAQESRKKKEQKEDELSKM